MGLFGSPTSYQDQDYDSLRKQAQSSGQLFTDTTFPPDDKALFYSGGSMKGIVWKRPKVSSQNRSLL